METFNCVYYYPLPNPESLVHHLHVIVQILHPVHRLQLLLQLLVRFRRVRVQLDRTLGEKCMLAVLHHVAELLQLRPHPIDLVRIAEELQRATG